MPQSTILFLNMVVNFDKILCFLMYCFLMPILRRNGSLFYEPTSSKLASGATAPSCQAR